MSKLREIDGFTGSTAPNGLPFTTMAGLWRKVEGEPVDPRGIAATPDEALRMHREAVAAVIDLLAAQWKKPVVCWRMRPEAVRMTDPPGYIGVSRFAVTDEIGARGQHD